MARFRKVESSTMTECDDDIFLKQKMEFVMVKRRKMMIYFIK